MLKQAERALRKGDCVIVYPEGTATRDPDLWPMVGKTGAARLALTTGAPVIPIAHWGAQDILPYGTKKLHLFPRKTVRMAAGPPVDLSAYDGQRLAASTLQGATTDIMADITALLATIRQETPPAVPWDPAVPRPGCPNLEPNGPWAPARPGPSRRAEDAAEDPPGGADMKAAVMGAGMWGTTFAQVLCDAGTRPCCTAAGRRWPGDQRAAREPGLPARASRCPRRWPPPPTRPGAGRRGHRGAGRARPDAAGQPGRTGRR